MAFRFFMLLASLVAAAWCSQPGVAQDLRLQVDVKQQSGPVSAMYRAGIFVGALPIGYPLEMFVSDQRPGMLQFSWQVYAPLRDALTEEEFFARLPESNLTTWVRATAADGAEPYILLMPIPRWLRAGGDEAGRHRLPRDLQGWEHFVQRVVDYYNNQLKIDARYIVWDEPNLFFDGTTEDYLLLYKHAAAGLLRANPKARIGGPAVSEFYAEIRPVKSQPTKPLLPALIRYCAVTPLPGLARRVPIDSLNWHTFDAAPVKSSQYDIEVRAARALLKENGYPENTELTIGSWSALDKYPGLQMNERDSHFLSSYIVASVIAMQKAGVSRHAFFNLFEEWLGPKEEFGNDEGLVTRNYIVKAGYNAFRLLGRLRGNAIPLDVPDPLVQAAAARDGKTLRLIVANFAPPAAMLKLRAQKQVGAAGYTRQKLAAALPPGRKLEDVLKDKASIEALPVPPEVRAAGLQLHDLVELSNLRQREPVRLQVAVNGMPSGRYRLSEYRIDADSNNAYALRGKIDEGILQRSKQAGRAAVRDYLAKRWNEQEVAQAQKLIQSGDMGAITDRIRGLPPERKRDVENALQAMQDVRFAPVRKINEALQPRAAVSEIVIDGTGTLPLQLPPYGVLLLELEAL
jgi:hypothetical protein